MTSTPPSTVAALGTAVSEINQQVLRQIEVTIRNYEREHSAERTENHGRDDLHEERRLSDSQFEPERTDADAARQVRQDAEELSEGAQTGSVEPPASLGEPVPAPERDRRDGEPETGTDDPCVALFLRKVPKMPCFCGFYGVGSNEPVDEPSGFKRRGKIKLYQCRSYYA